MQHTVFIEAWLLWLRPYRCLAAPWDPLLSRWMDCVLPRAAISRPDAVHGLVEHWWNLAGVVPRSLYLEVVERKEVLKTRLEEAEATIQQLRGAKGQDAEKLESVHTWETAINLWQTAIHTTVKAQTEWMRTWSDFASTTTREDEVTTWNG